MIEVLKEGTKKQCICENCGTEFSYDYEDIVMDLKKFFWITLRAKGTMKKYVPCPKCGLKIEVE